MSNPVYPKTVMALFSYSGVQEHTHECVMQELFHAASQRRPLGYSRISGDALIERSRSRALGTFLKSDHDVIVMIDHDITWRPGDVCELARIAHEKQALVGGLYCKRARGQGWASRVTSAVAAEFGAPTDDVIECDGLATGFMAIPRIVAQTIVDRLNIDGDTFKSAVLAETDPSKQQYLYDLSVGFIRDGAYKTASHEYYDFFRCFRRRVKDLNQHEFLSEDWAFSVRAVYCGFKTYIATRPVLGHTGEYCFQLQDGMDNQDQQYAQQVLNGPNQDPPTDARADKRTRRNPGSLHDKRSSKRRNKSECSGAVR